jgi:hypothetical protein
MTHTATNVGHDNAAQLWTAIPPGRDRESLGRWKFSNALLPHEKRAVVTHEPTPCQLVSATSHATPCPPSSQRASR